MRLQIWEEIRKRKLTQNEVAKDCHIHYSRLSQILSGREKVNIKEIRTLCRYFKMTEADLFSPNFQLKKTSKKGRK